MLRCSDTAYAVPRRPCAAAMRSHLARTACGKRELRITAIVMVVLSGILIAAHFFRSGAYWLAAISRPFPALLAIRTAFALRAVQLFLALAAVEWLRTLLSIAIERHVFGGPWVRMALILGTVTGLTVASAVLIGHTRRMPQGRQGPVQDSQREE